MLLKRLFCYFTEIYFTDVDHIQRVLEYKGLDVFDVSSLRRSRGRITLAMEERAEYAATRHVSEGVRKCSVCVAFFGDFWAISWLLNEIFHTDFCHIFFVEFIDFTTTLGGH